MDTLILLAFLGMAGYIVSLICWPFRACTLCKGTKTHDSPSGKFFRHCLKCGGSGYQLRLAIRIFNRLRT